MHEEMVNLSLKYIEDNITETVSLEQIAKDFYISPYHFSRIFTFLIGEPFRKYFLKRKISHSLKMLDDEASILQTALAYGFDYPESYARAFKQVFGVSPSSYKSGFEKIEPYGIGRIITRDMVNFKGDILIKSEYVYLNKMKLLGVSNIEDVTQQGWINNIGILESTFLTETSGRTDIDHSYHYVTARCMGNDQYYKFIICKMLSESVAPADLDRFDMSSGWYAKFEYKGSIADIYSTFDEDIRKWINKKKEALELEKNGVILRFRENKQDRFDVFVRLNRKL